MDKTIASLADAVAEIGDGATVMIGGFGGSGGRVVQPTATTAVQAIIARTTGDRCICG